MARKKVKSTALATNKITYEGSVRLKVKNGDKVLKTYDIKNSGTRMLFETIAMALTGSLSYIPNYIAVGAKAGNTVVTSDHLNEEIARVYITNKNCTEHRDTDGVYLGHKAVFAATIPYTSVNNMQIKELGLFGTETGNTLLARIPVTAGITLSKGMSLTIEWSVAIQNKM